MIDFKFLIKELGLEDKKVESRRFTLKGLTWKQAVEEYEELDFILKRAEEPILTMYLYREIYNIKVGLSKASSQEINFIIVNLPFTPQEFLLNKENEHFRKEVVFFLQQELKNRKK